jgi:hypothetical protein
MRNAAASGRVSQIMAEPLTLIGLAVAWFVLVRYVLPRAGVPT